MRLLASKHYDPSSLVSVNTTAITPMTAFDTTNLRNSFFVPPNGTVMVRIQTTVRTNASGVAPVVLFGVLEGSTVKGRAVPITAQQSLATSANYLSCEATFLVKDLHPGLLKTWDAAYMVAVALASTSMAYGGPEDTSANTAWGGITFEIWSTEALIAATVVDPDTRTLHAASSNRAQTAIADLALTFKAPTTQVFVRIAVPYFSPSASLSPFIFGVLGTGGLVGTGPMGGNFGVLTASTTLSMLEACFVVTGLTIGNTYTWTASAGIESAGSAGAGFVYGGTGNRSISFVGSTTGTNSGGSIAGLQAGDLLVAFANWDGDDNIPALASGWTARATGAGNPFLQQLSWRLASKVAADSSDTGGTFTGATELVIHAYRNAYSASSPFGAFTAPAITYNSTASYSAHTLVDDSGAGALLMFAGTNIIRAALNTPPSGGPVLRSTKDNTATAAGFDELGRTSNWTTTTVALGGSTAWGTVVTSLRGQDPPAGAASFEVWRA